MTTPITPAIIIQVACGNSWSIAAGTMASVGFKYKYAANPIPTNPTMMRSTLSIPPTFLILYSLI
jgi:hypothetical protein